MTEKELMKLQNGSDVRGIALEGVEGENVNLRPEAANLIAAAFVKFLSKKLGRPAGELKLAVGHDSRLSAISLKEAALQGILAEGAQAYDCHISNLSLIDPKSGKATRVAIKHEGKNVVRIAKKSGEEIK